MPTVDLLYYLIKIFTRKKIIQYFKKLENLLKTFKIKKTCNTRIRLDFYYQSFRKKQNNAGKII